MIKQHVYFFTPTDARDCQLDFANERVVKRRFASAGKCGRVNAGTRDFASVKLIVFEEITQQQVHLWYTRIAGNQESGLGAAYRSMLAPEETVQHRRFLFAKDRWRYLTTRALVRVVLSRYAPLSPREWEFQSSAHGRPSIKNKHPLVQKFDFNLSHTSDLVLLAISDDRRIGVDTEKITDIAPVELAEEYFSAKEVADLYALPQPARQNRFWEIWTLKESYLKAHGAGLSLSLNHFTFHFTEHQTVGIEFPNTACDSSSRWRFWQFMPDSTHLFSICLENTGDEPVSFVFREIVPLNAETVVEVSTIRSPYTLNRAGLSRHL